jgi:hypothetical protein
MNPSDSHSSSQKESIHPTPGLATEGWHRFVTGTCLLACVGIIVMGVARLFDPTEGRAVAAKPMDYITGIFFILLGVRGCRFLIRQLRPPVSAATRKQLNPK